MGRTDFCGGRDDLLIHMIETKLMKLPDETLVYPGHGYPTKIGVEKETNPYLS
ncbi:MAG: hypothetical protein H7X94_13505 [Vallitaleaceae bacterium]|nr:hypothetical protein [Vallitaleaceae bacterium]